VIAGILNCVELPPRAVEIARRCKVSAGHGRYNRLTDSDRKVMKHDDDQHFYARTRTLKAADVEAFVPSAGATLERNSQSHC
jgi:hypothetical protein